MVASTKISVIVPVYNVSAYLGTCLESILRQTFTDLEVVCVNDGSTDNSLDILNNYASKDNRIKVISQENKGLSGARNTGLKCVRGEFVSFIDSDDWIDLKYFEKLYNSITKNNCDIAVASIIRKKEKYKKYRVHYTIEKVYTTLEDKIKTCSIPKCCYACGKLYKKELLNNEFFTEGVYFEDVIWTPEILKKSSRLVTVPDTNYYYRANPSSIVKTASEKKINDRYNSKKYIIQFFDENNLKLREKDRYLTRSIKYIFNIPFFKIKEYKNTLNYYVFGVKVFMKISTET